MKIHTVEDYIAAIRREYVNEEMPLVKGYWLKLGLKAKELVDEGRFRLFDEASERFENELYKRMR